MIGCGDVTEVKSGPGFYKADHSQLVAVMRRRGELAADYARRHGVSRWHDNADAKFTEVSASVAKRAWARLIKQVSEVGPLICPRCTGLMRIIACIEQPEVIEKILTHLGVWPPTSTVRPPNPLPRDQGGRPGSA